MKNLFFSFLITTYFTTPIFADYIRAEFLTYHKAQEKWGIKPFSGTEFKNSKPSQRAPMAVDMIKSQLFIGKPIKDLRSELGEPDGYFFSDLILAYQIQEWSEQKKEAWQLIFIPNEKSLVSEIKIQKKCCYKEPSWPNK